MCKKLSNKYTTYLKEVNPSSHVGTCLDILMKACRVKVMHHTLCICMRHSEEAVTVCTTWEQHHTAHQAMWILQRLLHWHLPSPPSHHSQWASQCLPASLYLSNPLRLDPTPPTAPTQSDNPIRTHGQLTSRDAESMFAYRLEIRNVRAHKWDKTMHSQDILKCKSMPESGTAHTRAHLTLHLALSIMVQVY